MDGDVVVRLISENQSIVNHAILVSEQRIVLIIFRLYYDLSMLINTNSSLLDRLEVIDGTWDDMIKDLDIRRQGPLHQNF